MHKNMNQIEIEANKLIDAAKELIEKRKLSEFIYCSYHSRKRGNYLNIELNEVNDRIRFSIFEGFNVELIPSLSQLILCIWEYPGPKPEGEYVVHFVDIPSFVKDLEGE